MHFLKNTNGGWGETLNSVPTPLPQKPWPFFKNKFIYLFIYLFVYLFLAALGLCCCARAFSSCGERGLLFVAVHRLLIAVASLVAEHGL